MSTIEDVEKRKAQVIQNLEGLGEERIALEKSIEEDRAKLHARIEAQVAEGDALRVLQEEMYGALQISSGRLWDRYIRPIREKQAAKDKAAKKRAATRAATKAKK